MSKHYTPISFFKNMKDYGIRTAWSHDRERTKENRDSRLEQASEYAAFGLLLCIGVPLAIGLSYKLNRDINKTRKQSKKREVDEGFSPEVHDNKNQIKRY